MSAHNRSGPPAGPSAPSHPRGGGYRGRGAPRGAYRGDFSRGGGGGGIPYHPRDQSRDYDATRPGTSISLPSRHYRDSHNAPGLPAFRSSNSTTTTYPQTKRFASALADLATLKDGGERLPPLHDTARADKLEEEAARLRKLIDDKEQIKRAGLREWANVEREAGTAGLRSELAEEGLRRLNGEGSGTAAF